MPAVDSLSPPAIVFDLDGTLVDTAPDLHATLNVVLEDLGCAGVSLEQVRAMVGDGVRALLERGLRAGGMVLHEAAMTAATAHYLRHYGTNLARSSRPFPGVTVALDALADRGFRLAVCTNKPHALSLALLEALGLLARFDAVVGGDHLAMRKPDPGHLLGTLAAAGAKREGSVMVGDSRNDVAVARAAGLPVVLVSFGYTAVPARALGADAIIDDFAELAVAIGKVLAA